MTAEGTPLTWLKLIWSVGRRRSEEGQEPLVGRPHVDGVTRLAEGHAGVAVGIDMEAVETDAVGGGTVRGGKMALHSRWPGRPAR